jgi:hypothetical protein
MQVDTTYTLMDMSSPAELENEHAALLEEGVAPAALKNEFAQ